MSRWIPCEERLPSEQGEYLVTIPCMDENYVDVLDYGKDGFYDISDEWGVIPYEDNEVIAWMPLPEPYGEREGE